MYPLHQRFQKHFFDGLVFTPIFPLSKSRFRCIQRVVVKVTETVYGRVVSLRTDYPSFFSIVLRFLGVRLDNRFPTNRFETGT